MKIALLALTKNRFTNGIQNCLEVYGNEVERIEYNPTAEYLSRFDLGVSWFWNHILTPEQIAAPRHGILNSHIGYLPVCRGSCPNVWAIAGNLPAGVTIHWIDSGVDTGPIIFQQEVEKRPTDTGETLYNRLCVNMAHLFKESWYWIQSSLDGGDPVPCYRQVGEYKTYRMKDLQQLDDLESLYGEQVARSFVDTIRARTFMGHEAAYIRDDQGRKVYVRVSLNYE